MTKLCNICPRNCNVDRSKGVGFCGARDKIFISKVMIHQYEEPCISGEDGRGSGAIFFASCNLKCVYCQNYKISRRECGEEYGVEEFVALMKRLEAQGVHNINLVTPTHYTEEIVEALEMYKPSIPIVWNTSGYEKGETIARLAGLVDVFLTDFKYCDGEVARRYSRAGDYCEYASEALKVMREIVPRDVIVDGIMQKGIIVRHLLLPDNLKDSLNVLARVKELIGNPILSLMSQYTPMQKYEYDELNKRIRPIEYKMLLRRAQQLGFDRVYMQDFSSASDEYTPEF